MTRAGADSAEEIGYWDFTGGVMAAAFAGWIVYLIFSGKSFRERMRLLVPVSAAVLLTSWSAGSAGVASHGTGLSQYKLGGLYHRGRSSCALCDGIRGIDLCRLHQPDSER